MKCSLGISNFLEEISSLSHSVVPHQSKTPFSPPPSGSLHKPLSSLCERADRRSMNHHNPTATKTKPHYRKLIRMKKQRFMSQMKRQDKIPEKQLNEDRQEGLVHGVARSRTRLSCFTFTFHFHALEKEMATHSSVLAWRIPGTGEPGGLPSLGSHRIGHD